MTIRGLAAKILGASVRRASPSMQEWGKAMLAEMEHVEGDWAALFWAFGGARSLLWAWNSPIKSLADVPGKLQRFEKKVRKRTILGLAGGIGLIAYFAYFVLVFSNQVARVGAALTIGALIFMMHQLYRHRLGRGSTNDSTPDLIGRFRIELSRQRDFHRGVDLWSRLVILLPPYLLFCVGMGMEWPLAANVTYGIEICATLFAVAAVPLNLREARKYQRQIDELDVLRKELP